MTGGEILLHERFVKKAITIKEVSEKTGIAKEQISAIELNNKIPTFEELFLLNDFYGVKLKMQDFRIVHNREGFYEMPAKCGEKKFYQIKRRY